MLKLIVQLILVVTLFTMCKTNTKVDLSGTYRNTNFEYEPFMADVPYVDDTLILRSDLTFSSKFYGVGKYKIQGEILRLNYSYEYGKAYRDFLIEEDFKGQPILLLNRDNNHFYEKIN